MAATDISLPTPALIGLGSNLQEPESQVRRALVALDTIAGTRVLRRSRLFRSAPWGVTDQPAFVNAVAEVATRLDPHALLAAMQAIERAQGRLRDGSRWGPRTLDLDLLTWGDCCLSDPGLTLPHPHIRERAFVLLPLADLDANLVVPNVGRVADLLMSVDAEGCAPIEG